MQSYHFFGLVVAIAVGLLAHRLVGAAPAPAASLSETVARTFSAFVRRPRHSYFSPKAYTRPEYRPTEQSGSRTYARPTTFRSFDVSLERRSVCSRRRWRPQSWRILYVHFATLKKIHHVRKLFEMRPCLVHSHTGIHTRSMLVRCHHPLRQPGPTISAAGNRCEEELHYCKLQPRHNASQPLAHWKIYEQIVRHDGRRYFLRSGARSRDAIEVLTPNRCTTHINAHIQQYNKILRMRSLRYCSYLFRRFTFLTEI